jgi:hypothetical protein
MLDSGIDRRLSCTSFQHFATAETTRRAATQSRRESSSEVHAH